MKDSVGCTATSFRYTLKTEQEQAAQEKQFEFERRQLCKTLYKTTPTKRILRSPHYCTTDDTVQELITSMQKLHSFGTSQLMCYYQTLPQWNEIGTGYARLGLACKPIDRAGTTTRQHQASYWYTPLYKTTPSKLLIHSALQDNTRQATDTLHSTRQHRASYRYTPIYKTTPGKLLIHYALQDNTKQATDTLQSTRQHRASYWYTPNLQDNTEQATDTLRSKWQAM